MANNVTDWVWKHSQSVNAGRIVLLAIAHEANREGDAAMSVEELAIKCHLGERTVQMATKELLRLGEIRVRPKAGEHGRNGYRVIMARGANPAPLAPADSAPQPSSRGADIAPPQILHPADSAPHEPPKPQVTPAKGADSAPQPISDVFIEATGIQVLEVKDVPAVDERPDVARICAHLADRIEANGSKRPAITTRWRNSARLMIDRDGRTEQQIMTAIDWCQDNEFWRANILSMPKLREKYEQLRLQARRASNGHRSTTNDRVRQAREAGRRVQAMLQGDQ